MPQRLIEAYAQAFPATSQCETYDLVGANSIRDYAGELTPCCSGHPRRREPAPSMIPGHASFHIGEIVTFNISNNNLLKPGESRR